VEARRKIGVQPRVIAEVPESQMGQMHVEKIGARTACPRVFSEMQIVNDKFSKPANSRFYEHSRDTPFGNNFAYGFIRHG
jgi:hypothetical protein